MSSIAITGLAPEDAVQPHDCALLVAAPLDRSQFFADLERRDKEFARNFRRKFAVLNEDALWQAYAPFATVARETLERAREVGVRVVDQATLKDFLAALYAKTVTTLVAHWRSARFREEDIVDAGAVRVYLGARRGTVESGEADYDGLNRVLDRLAGEDCEHAEGSPGYAVARQYAWHAARALMERDLDGAVKGGAAVEFAEGFCPVSEIVAQIPEAYVGTLDLTVCQSVMLGEEIKRRCRHCAILTSAGLTSMDYRFALYRQVIEILALRPQPFEAAMAAVRAALVREYGRKSSR